MQRTIAHYELLTELGHGAMATIFRARDTRLGREVAMKLLRREYLSDLGFRSRFEQEATLVAALSHRANIPIYEFGQHEEQLFLVMPYMAKGSLATRLAGPQRSRRSSPARWPSNRRPVTALSPASTRRWRRCRRQRALPSP